MADAEDIKRILSKHRDRLAGQYGIKRLGLFGSYSDHSQTDTSDVDIVVEFNEPIGLEFVDLAEELERLLHSKVDLVSRGAIKPGMWRQIEKDIVYV
jgi:hypothetical protein